MSPPHSTAPPEPLSPPAPASTSLYYLLYCLLLHSLLLVHFFSIVPSTSFNTFINFMILMLDMLSNTKYDFETTIAWVALLLRSKARLDTVKETQVIGPLGAVLHVKKDFTGQNNQFFFIKVKQNSGSKNL